MNIIEHPESYEVRDDDDKGGKPGKTIKFFYFEEERTRRDFMGRMTKRQARDAAKAFVGGASVATETGAKPMASPPRRFTRPWHVIEHDDSFEITDATGLNLCFVHFEDEATRRGIMKQLTKDEARRLAKEIARLPALLRIEKGIDPGEA